MKSGRKSFKGTGYHVLFFQIVPPLEEQKLMYEAVCRGIIAEKPSSELFTLDTSGSTAIKSSYRRKHKPLKADEILAQRSSIPALESRKRSAPTNVTDGVLSERGPKRPKIPRAEVERLRRIASGESNKGADTGKLVQAEATHDPWADASSDKKEQKEPTLPFLEPKVPVRAPPTIKQAPVSLLANGLHAPAVRKPNAGRSYNPAFEDWDALVSKAGASEVEAERRRQEAAAAEAELQDRVQRSAVEADAAEQRELQRDGGDGDGGVTESEWEGIESFDEADLVRKRPERKTKAQRNKIKRRKEAEREAAREAAQRKKEKEVGRVKLLARELDERQRRAAKLKAASQSIDDVRSDSSDAEEVVRQRRFGKAVYVPSPLFFSINKLIHTFLFSLHGKGKSDFLFLFLNIVSQKLHWSWS